MVFILLKIHNTIIKFFNKGIHTLAFGHKEIAARLQNAPQAGTPHDRFISAAEAAQEGRLFGDNHVIQAGVDPTVFCREARFFRAVAQASVIRPQPQITTIDELAQQENRNAAKIIVEAAAANAYANVTHLGIGPDEVDSLLSIAHTWLLQKLPSDVAISRIETLLEVLHENQDELNVDDLPNVLGDDN